MDFTGDPAAKTIPSQSKGPRFDPRLGNQILQVAYKILHVTTKDQISCVPQIRPSTAKLILLKKQKTNF